MKLGFIKSLKAKSVDLWEWIPYTVYTLNFMSVGWDVKKVSRVTDHNPFGTQKIVSLMFEKEWAQWKQSGKSKFSNPTKQLVYFKFVTNKTKFLLHIYPHHTRVSSWKIAQAATKDN
jgi:hypothetical protein